MSSAEIKKREEEESKYPKVENTPFLYEAPAQSPLCLSLSLLCMHIVVCVCGFVLC